MATNPYKRAETSRRADHAEDFWPFIKQILGTEKPDPALIGHLDGDLFARRARRNLRDGPGEMWPTLFVKNLLDRLLAVIVLVFLAPLLLVIAVLVRASSHGPIFFRQTRVGRNGRTFSLLKFRTMVMDDEVLLGRAMESVEPDGPLFRIRHDPRVTRLGRFLRRYSMDELPQLVNVVKGEMSLVGPRPVLPAELRHLPEAARRLQLKPGLTGLWQLSGRYDLTWEESVRLDRRYIESWSITLDLMILWRTVTAVLVADVRPRGWNEPDR